jgi:hypothetical protein
VAPLEDYLGRCAVVVVDMDMDVDAVWQVDVF